MLIVFITYFDFNNYISLNYKRIPIIQKTIMLAIGGKKMKQKIQRKGSKNVGTGDLVSIVTKSNQGIHQR